MMMRKRKCQYITIFFIFVSFIFVFTTSRYDKEESYQSFEGNIQTVKLFKNNLCSDFTKTQIDCVNDLVERRRNLNDTVFFNNNLTRPIITNDLHAAFQITNFLCSANIMNVEFLNVGTQPKLFLQLNNSKFAIFKPKWYSSRWKTDDACSSFDRHSGEILAYHLSLILGFVTVSPTCGRTLNMEKEILSVKNSAINSLFYRNKNKRLCIKIPCRYCRTPLCCLEDGTISGSVSLWYDKTFESLDYPWGATCTQKSDKGWFNNPLYCSKILKNETFSKNNLYLDMIDIGIFDFLIDNVDRHHLQYEIASDGRFNFVLFDNGKSLANPDKDHSTLLAPLYQCCRIKKSTLDILKKLFENQRMLDSLEKSMKLDGLHRDISQRHLLAINKRLGTVLTIVNLCVDYNGFNNVIVF